MPLVKITQIDSKHGSFYQAYVAMGSPEYPTPKQIRELKRAGGLPGPEVRHLSALGEITLSIPANGVALLESA